jgi:hypothetical protein
MTKTALLAVIILVPFLMAGGCGTARPTPSGSVPPEMSQADKLEFEQQAERMKAREKAFAELTRKMNEYQDFQVICDSIAESDDKRQIKATCNRVLRTMRQELLGLSEMLQEPE